MTIIPPTTTPLDHLRAVLQGGNVPPDLITPFVISSTSSTTPPARPIALPRGTRTLPT